MSIPDGAVYYDGFEQGNFPDGDPEWTTTGGDDAPREVFSVLAGTDIPYDDLLYYVDGEI